ncbi:beta-lactamase/transpeptidase-like protein, partial [Mycena maculata]
IAALQLIGQGRIGLDTPVEQVLPELANPVVVTARDEAGKPRSTTPAKVEIAFGQLLNHSSGLDYSLDGTTPNGMLNAYPHSLQRPGCLGVLQDLSVETQGSLAGVPLKFEPGTDFGADAYDLTCSRFIIERLSGKSLEKYLIYFLRLLGIKHTSFYLTPPLKERLLPLSYRNESGTIQRWNRPLVVDHNPASVNVHFVGSGLFSSQKDYLAILRHWL